MKLRRRPKDDHQHHILQEFQDATAQKERADELKALADHAVSVANANYEEKRKALRRVAEGSI